MNYKSGFIDIRSEKLHYIKMGEGNKLLIAFHGYGNDAGIFGPFMRYLDSVYTMISIDLPYHGRSDWNGPDKLSKADVLKMTQQLMLQAGVESVSLLGYSMGGRVCLTIIEQMGANIDKVLLIAPDGLAFNPLYYFLTKTYFGKRLFNSVLITPKKYFRLLGWGRDKKLLNAFRYNFAMQYLQSDSSRNLLHKAWPGMNQIIPDLRKLKAAIRKFKIPMFIFMGANDRVIPAKLGSAFITGLDTVQLFVLDKGHRVFDYESTPQMAKCLL